MLGRRRGEHLEAALLERGVVRDHRLGRREHRGERRCAAGARVAGASREPRVVLDRAVGACEVDAPLHGDVLVRVAAVPRRDAERDRLEVEVGDRRSQRVERGAERRLDDERARLHGAPLPLLHGGELEPRGQVVERLVPVGEELREARRPDGMKRRDVVLGERGPASPHERARVGRVAVRSGLDLGQGAAQHRELTARLARHVADERLDVVGDVGAVEEVREVGEGAPCVEVHQLDPIDGEPRAAQDVGLHGGVGQVLLLDAHGRLHLGQRGAAAAAQREDVDGDEDVVLEERRLVEHARAVVERPPRLRDALAGTGVRSVDEHPSGDVISRCLAHARAGVERRLKLRPHGELGRARLVGLPPEALVALEPGDELRLGETRMAGHPDLVPEGAAGRTAGRTKYVPV